ncbi:hypothetical protein J4410_03245 [Candidatus Woesearchaeota archaeon]|nr:hypothetical protein [Candidatus Woesearchaeota archaeon]
MTFTFGKRIEELILLLAIVLNVLDFFEILPGDFDYLDKIMSWAILGYLLYHTHLTEVFFGEQKKWFDLSLIFSYFFLILKELVGYAYSVVDEVVYVKEFFIFLIDHAKTIEFTGLIIGGSAILLLSFIAALRFPFKKPSLLCVLHPEGYPQHTFWYSSRRFFLITFTLFGFFVIFFNLFMEWAAVAVDAPLLMVALLAYVFLVLIRRRFSSEGLLFRLGAVGEEFYKKFIYLFHQKETIALGISGMLVLHLLTDLANFVIPMLMGVHDAIYLNQIGFTGRQTFFSLFSQQIIGATSLGEIISIAWIYFFNILGIIFLMAAPTVLWYNLFRDKQIHIPLVYLFLFYISLTCFLLASVFTITPINNPQVLVGVDIQNHLFTPLFGFHPVMVIGISFAVALIVTLLSLVRKIKHFFVGLGGAGIFFFFGLYITLFFYDQIKYYAFAIPILLQENWFILFLFFLFLVLTVLFYVGGYLLTLWELIKEIKGSD